MWRRKPRRSPAADYHAALARYWRDRYDEANRALFDRTVERDNARTFAIRLEQENAELLASLEDVRRDAEIEFYAGQEVDVLALFARADRAIEELTS